jgi:hypothetical protein
MPKGHAVVDGSNLATEGRSEPSLAQLDDAVAAFSADHDFAHVTVVVDASFEHRVLPKEQTAAKRAIDDGRIVTPPAGAIGRGDAFILQIADRANAVVLSNDSFQEFHGRYEWLFDEGRLIGGKPVEHVGWVFVARLPVRGPTSRDAVRKAKKVATTPQATEAKDSKTESGGSKRARRAKKTGSATEPAAPADAGAEPTRAKKGTERTRAKKGAEPARAKKGAEPARAERGADGENPVRAWQRFRREHPVGSTVEATVDQFASHGAYAIADGLSAYVPTSLLAHPAPARARDILAEGEPLTFVVHAYHEDRRGIDLGLLPAKGSVEPTAGAKPAKKATGAAKKAGASKATPKKGTDKTTSNGNTRAKRSAADTAAKKSSARRSGSRR